MTPGARLAATALDFGYPGHPVGKAVSIGLEAGEVVCLLGPNGGGKSTLFRTLLGLLPAQGGAIALNGEALGTLPRAEVARRVSYVPQAHTGYFPFTVLDVVLMGRTAHLPPFAAPARRDVEIAHQSLARLRIDRLAGQVYTRISGGERQLALIARALAQAAPLMVMDEPTASLDVGNQVRVLDEIRALAASGIGVLIATHDPDHAFVCADRVAMLHGGRLLVDASPDEAITPATLRTVYGIDAVLVDVDIGGANAVGYAWRAAAPRPPGDSPRFCTSLAARPQVLHQQPVLVHLVLEPVRAWAEVAIALARVEAERAMVARPGGEPQQVGAFRGADPLGLGEQLRAQAGALRGRLHVEAHQLRTARVVFARRARDLGEAHHARAPFGHQEEALRIGKARCHALCRTTGERLTREVGPDTVAGVGVEEHFDRQRAQRERIVPRGDADTGARFAHRCRLAADSARQTAADGALRSSAPG
jgi:iron complex transport system ATP-binding protein